MSKVETHTHYSTHLFVLKMSNVTYKDITLILSSIKIFNNLNNLF